MKKYNKNYVNNESGLTLVEIIAALLILSIILLSFFAFFTQSAKFTKHNKENLTAVQVAEDVVAEIRPINSIDELEGYTINNGTYVNSLTYSPFEVKITISDGPVPRLKKANISVKSTSTGVIQNKEYRTEMYFKVTP